MFLKYRNLFFNSSLKVIVFFLIIISLCSLSCSVQKINTENKANTESELKLIEFKYTFAEAGKHEMLGNFDDANTLYNACLKLNPNSSASYYALGNIAIKRSNFELAVHYIQNAVNINSQNKWYKLLLVELYRVNNNLEKAIEIYKTIIKSYPNNIDYLHELAGLYTESGDYNNAIAILDSIEIQLGVNELISLSKNQIYVKQGKKELIEVELNKLLLAFPDNLKYYSMLAEYYTLEGKYVKANNLYKKMLVMDGTNGFVRFQLANYYLSIKNYEKAFDQFEIAFASYDVEAQAKIRVLLSNLIANDIPSRLSNRSYKLLDVFISVHPDQADGYLLYADFLVRDKKLKLAREHVQSALKIKHDAYRVWEQLIALDMDLGDFKSMLNHCTEAVEYFPNQANLFLLQGMAALRLNKYEDAAKSLDMGFDLVIDNTKLKSDFYFYIGEVQHKLNNFEKSDEAFEKLLELDLNNIVVLNNYSYYLSERGVKLERALELSQLVIDSKPNNSTYLDTYSWILYKMKKYDKALKYIKIAIDNEGNTSSVIVEHYGDILYKLNRINDAKIQWSKALELGVGSKFLKEKVEKGLLVE